MDVVVQLSNLAKIEYDEIHKQIYEIAGPQKVVEFNESVTNVVSLLKFNPKMGKVIRNNYRSVIIGKYRFVYYYVEKKQAIVITRIFHVKNHNYNKPWNLRGPDQN